MNLPAPAVSPRRAAGVGLLCLAAAMGIGRFAFTPMLPLMQAQVGLTLTEGAWLAAANYLGYLIGALAALWRVPAPARAARQGLVAVALFTLAMALPGHAALWMVWRLGAGVASAWVLVGVSGWALVHLAAAGRSALGGVVFAGVGIGIVAAGSLVLVAAAAPVAQTWAALGALAAVVALVAWPALNHAAPKATPTSSAPGSMTLGPAAWALVLSYGLFGLGYIVPATFLPALAREHMADPLLFGLAWPLFGLAALASTLLVARFAAHRPPRQLALGAHVVMAVGVLAPVLQPSLAAIVVSALCVGGTFMVATMAGLQEARRLAVGPPTRLMAAMTAAFALGQLIGPLLLSRGSSATEAMRVPSLAAATLLVVGALLLAFVQERAS